MLKLYSKKSLYFKILFAKKKRFKKLVLVLRTFISVTSKKSIILDHILYIYYLVHFQKNSNNIEVLLDSCSKINIMTFIYASKLGFQV